MKRYRTPFVITLTLAVVALIAAAPAQIFRTAIDLNTNKIINLGTPSASTDAVTLSYATNASNLASGTVPTARLGSGSASSSTFLRGDSTWAASSGISTSDAVDLMPWWGDGSDGAVSLSSGTTTLTRDMHYTTLTLTSTAKIKTAGFRVHCSVLLDISNAGQGAIHNEGNAGGNSSTAGGGSQGTAITATAIGGGVSGTAGGDGTTAAGVSSSNVGTASPSNGGAGARGGRGGTSGGSQGATSGTIGATTARPIKRATFDLLYATTLISGANGSSGGGGGRGDGSYDGGGGGGGGGGSGVVWIAARTISRGGSTTAGCLSVKGANGGNGGPGQAGNAAGGGGGGGGSGGWLVLIYGSLSGSSATNAITASGGTGGTGGTGQGTGTGGAGGDGGTGGRILVINAGTGTVSETVGSAGSSGGAVPGTTTGAAGGAGNTTQVSL